MAIISGHRRLESKKEEAQRSANKLILGPSKEPLGPKIQGVGEQLKRARKKVNWTQTDLALSLGMAIGAIAMFESGKRFPRANRDKHQNMMAWIRKVKRLSKEQARVKYPKPPLYSKHPVLNRSLKKCENPAWKNSHDPGGYWTTHKSKTVRISRGEFGNNSGVCDPDTSSLARIGSLNGDSRGISSNITALWSNGSLFPPILCAYCQRLRLDEEITLDDSLVAKYICEDCYRIERTRGKPLYWQAPK